MDFKAKYLEVVQEHDPLLPFEAGFKASLDWLNRFEKIVSGSLIVFRTRSPLVVLLAPVLKRFESRIKVIIPIEALNDSLHSKLDPQGKLPRPSERLHAAKALKQLGFDVELELRPFISESASSDLPTVLLKDFAKICDESASKVFLRDGIYSNTPSRADFYFSQKLGGHLLSAKLLTEHAATRCAA